MLNDALCLQIRPGAGVTIRSTVLIVPPLFDEANRMRRTLVLMMRALGAMGHAAILPDLPGHNDSMIDNRHIAIPDMRSALADWAEHVAATAPVVIASLRGGALIDDAATTATGWWRMAPSTGASVVKTLIRTRIAGDKEAGRASTAEMLRETARNIVVQLAGYHVSGSLLDDLDQMIPTAVAPLRTVTVGTGPGQVMGTPLWLRAEPGEDAAMAAAMAADIAAWSTSCAGG